MRLLKLPICGDDEIDSGSGPSMGPVINVTGDPNQRHPETKNVPQSRIKIFAIAEATYHKYLGAH